MYGQLYSRKQFLDDCGAFGETTTKVSYVVDSGGVYGVCGPLHTNFT